MFLMNSFTSRTGPPPIVRRSLAQWIILWILRIIPRRFKLQLYGFARQWSERNGLSPWPEVYRLPFSLVLKTAVFASTNEAAALQFVETLGINSSRFIDHASGGPDDMYLLSTWIPGPTCANVWNELTAKDKDMIVEQLRTQIIRLREKTISFNHVICNAEGNVVRDPRIPWVYRENPKEFTTCKEFFQQVWISFERRPRYGGSLGPLIQPLIDRADRPIVFSHGDLLRKNIVLPGGLEEWRRGHSTVCLIDWENAGWLPLQWEAIKATWLCSRTADWYKMMKELFPESSAEIDADFEYRERSWAVIA